jgi:site-specific DNA recombinase
MRQPEVVGTCRAARNEQDDITEDEAREALLQLDPLWDELFPAEQARIVQLLVERVDVRTHGVEVRLRPNGLAGLVREVAGSARAAALRGRQVSADGETITGQFLPGSGGTVGGSS